jgi:hypothetical protein
LLGGGGPYGPAQFVAEFALLLERGQDGRAPFFQLAQIEQAFIQITQVRIVQVTGGLLAIARDKGHGRTFIEQRYSSSNLMRPDSKFLGDELNNLDLCSF